MARKSLSQQVIDEVDRARGLLEPVKGIVDPMTAHMVGAVLESLHRIEGMCISARQRDVNDGLATLAAAPSPATAVVLDPPKAKRSTPHRAPRTKREA
jgi:hypothetical protein